MWNPFNYISSGSPNQFNIQGESQVVAEQNNIKVKERYLIDEYNNYQKRIKQFQSLIVSKSHNQQQNARMVRIFSELIRSLQQFLDMLGGIKKQYQVNLQKIEDYDRVKKKLQNHSFIVQNIQKDHERQIDNSREKYRRKQMIYETNLNALQKQLQSMSTEHCSLQEQIKELKRRNCQLQLQNEQLQQKQSKTNLQSEQLKLKLSLLTKSPMSSLSTPPLQSKGGQNNKIQINLQTILFCQQKILSGIISFLSASQMIKLSLGTKKISHSLMKKLPHVIYGQMSRKLDAQVGRIKEQSIYYDRLLLQQFDDQNIKVNAIKYLFFKNKPGTYILSMFQEDITKLDDQGLMGYNQAWQATAAQSDAEQQTSKASWRDYFKPDRQKKQQSKQSPTSRNSTNSQKFSLAQLKSSQNFKRVQQHFSKSFHHNFFSLKLPKDLESFGKMMQDKFSQLKKQMSGFNNSSQLTIREWTSKLLTLSKFLYLQSQQLWGLCQTIFVKLINFEKQNYSLKSQLEDLAENNNGLRKLVEELAKSKMEMQKRIWQSQRKSGFLKTSAQNVQKINLKLQKQIQTTRDVLENQQTKSYQLQKQLSQCKQRFSVLHKKYKQKMAQFYQLKEEVSKILWV